MDIMPIEWLHDRVRILDQTRLPGEEVYLELSRYQDIASAIVELKIRGGPAIGVGVGYAIALGALKIKSTAKEDFVKRLHDIARKLADTRPTARNLFWAIERMLSIAGAGKDVGRIKNALVEEAIMIHRTQIEADRKLSRIGAGLIGDGATVLTHCNTGALATAGYGTALGVIKQAAELGKKIVVITTDTRPLLQGARLNSWELQHAGIPFRLITDSMAGYFMRRGEVSCVIVGADRIAANGYTANKIGTYSLAVLANAHGIPFYVAAPTSTIDTSLVSGYQIPIEERSLEEVTRIRGVAIAPEGTEVYNPAFDVTPSQYITAIITERGIIRKPYGKGIKDIS
jgi:methylthioribose-1-phosphate isomerase